MRRDMVEAALADIAEELFEDVVYTHAPDAPRVITNAIFGVEVAAARYEEFGAGVRDATHVTRAIASRFPALAKGDVIDDGVRPYRVLDWEPAGDGRFEILISLRAL